MTRAFTLTNQLKIKPVWTQDTGATTLSDNMNLNEAFQLTSTADPADLTFANGFWKDQITVTAAGTTLDLLALPQKIFGGSGTLGITNVKVVFVQNVGNESAKLFGNASGRWPGLSADEITVGPGAIFYVQHPAGYSVTAGSSNVLVAAETSSATVNVVFIGEVNYE